MKKFLLPAFATLLVVLAWLAVSPTSAKAYSAARCIYINGYTYCLTSYYTPGYCVYRKYYGVTYIYCRH